MDKGGRVDPEEVINELMEDIQLDNMAGPEGKREIISCDADLTPFHFRLWRVATVPRT